MTPAQSVLAIDIYEPSDRADRLLAAIAAKLGLEKIDPHGDTYVQVHVPLDWTRAYELAEQALDEAGDDGRMIVRVLTPS